ncbi:hypothetical protein AK830_g6151 [Neonectria ditissima]|uniref:Uncharacterized protein n=1 Tax=Neonectria ditissima TaxID=78410 RepID=A0A0P7B1S3_9HYPO|nr:hypothetical protein AK830_g6151 [Neonectria ditissima]
MRSFSLLLLPALLAPTVSAGVDLKETCSKLDGVIGSCTGTYLHPVGAVAKKCTSGGTTRTCGVTVLTETRYLCAAVRSGMPDNNDGDKFIRRSEGICSYLPAMKLLSEAENFYPYFEYADVSSASNAALVDTVHNIDRGIRDDNLAIGSNRRNVLSEIATDGEGSGYLAVRAADATLDVYKKFRRAIDGCYNGDGCDQEEIGYFFADYINASDDILDGALYKQFKTWVDLFMSIEKKIAAVKTASKNVQAHLKTASAKVSSVKSSACKNNACKGSVATKFLKQVSDSLAAFKALDATSAGADKASLAVKPTQALISEAIRGLYYALDNQELANLVNFGDISQLGNIILGFRITKGMPDIALRMKKEIIPIILLTKFSTKGSTASKSLDTVLATDWNKKKDLFKTPAARKVRDGFISIQATMKKELRGPLDALNKEIKGLDDALNKFQLRKKNLDWSYGSYSVRRYTVNAINIPCKSSYTETFTVEGYTATYTYPIFESCLYGPDLIYIPNHHIPYLRWSFSTPS